MTNKTHSTLPALSTLDLNTVSGGGARCFLDTYAGALAGYGVGGSFTSSVAGAAAARLLSRNCRR